LLWRRLMGQRWWLRVMRKTTIKSDSCCR